MRSLVSRPALLSILCVSMLSACTTTGTRPAGGGSLFGRSAQPSTPFLANLQGGIVGRTGVQLDRGDQTKALEAEYKALETSPVGTPVSWTGDDASGQVVANAPYQVGNQNCRQYSHTLTVDEKETRVRGAACRNADGSWSPLT
ncbi:membrane protein [Rhizobium nepotum]|uniref:Membrane protein n=1 Tax=Rhizobium nepotum 39/7 TaxID=1368418 RepID=A0ABR5CXM6_9HYPH|nr:membrane protein [Rhizobium nepotum]KJF69602.1 membrane protein [Rhizobium nepotum 39/7]